MKQNFTGILYNFLNYLFWLVGIAALSFISSCGSDDPSVDCSMVNISVSAATMPSECPASTGSVTITASGGGGNFEYSIDGENFQGSNIFNNVAAGNYTAIARDPDGCRASVEVMVEAMSDISFTTVTTTAAGCGGNAGSLTIIASGGDGNFQFSLDEGSFQENNQFDNLSNGWHMITIRDGNGCTASGEGYVASGISYSETIAPIVSTYCAVSGCHVAGEPQPDFSVFENVQAAASEVRSRTQSGNMPRGSTLTAGQIEAIACWVDDGALNN